jgi:hypothetical protein
LRRFENIGKFLSIFIYTPGKHSKLKGIKMVTYWHHPQLAYVEVGYREQSVDYIFRSEYFTFLPLCGDL